LAVLFMAAPSQASTVGAMPKASIGVWVNNTRYDGASPRPVAEQQPRQ